jgi:poly-beta-1,6-N-acetyl-D-glucosamine synthase
MFLMGKNIYVLITPARNEAASLEKTIKAMISQTILPKKWVIVSDGSTDRTDEIASRYAAEYDFLQFIRVKPNDIRNFASKVRAIRAGFEQLEGIEYEFFGNLDADVSFEPNYYERVLEKFQQNPKLGIVGGIILDKHSEQFERRFGESDACVAGAIQLFRRECYEEIGGYIPLKYGGVDVVAMEMAKMHGWEVQSFPEIEVLHYRRTGTADTSIYLTRFIEGKEDYSLGYHSLFFLAKCLYRVLERPYAVGSLLRLCGYGWSCCRREKREVPADFVKYVRQKQMRRLISTNSYKKLLLLLRNSFQ